MDELRTEQNSVEQQPHVPVTQQLLILGAILLLLLGTGYVPRLYTAARDQITDTTTKQGVETKATTVSPAPDDNPFDTLSVQAHSAYVWDVVNQRALYKKSADQQWPLASITKLMTALVAYELVASTNQVTITTDAVKQDGESFLRQGEQFTFQDLLDLTLMTSSNDGAYALAATAGAVLRAEDEATAFVEAMNVRAQELGLTQTYFRNPTGLDITEDESGAYSSARDVTFLMEYILQNHPQILSATTQPSAVIQSQEGDTHNSGNTNPVVDRIPGLIGSKTGFTELAGGNLVIAFDAAFNRPVIVVVLGSTYTGRFDDVLALTNAARTALSR